MRQLIPLAILCWVGLPQPATAQGRLLLQAPVFARFSVQTTAVAPDRGGILTGSVSRAAAGRNSFGPGRAGSSLGRSLEHRSQSTHVFVHDFAAMDPFLRGGNSKRPRPVDPVAERLARQQRAVQAYLRLALKAEAAGRQETAARYRAKAAEYAARARTAGLPGRP